MRDYVGKTDHDLLVEIYTNMEQLTGIVEDHEGRIRELEQSKWKMYGIAGALGYISAKVSGLFNF